MAISQECGLRVSLRYACKYLTCRKFEKNTGMFSILLSLKRWFIRFKPNFYSACRRRGGVLKCPRFWVFFIFFLFFFGVESWAAAHGLYRCTEYRLLSEPMSTRLLNSISSRICRQNTQFNMYTTTSKQQEGCTFKDSHPKCFITTNFDKFHREAFARGGESR